MATDPVTAVFAANLKRLREERKLSSAALGRLSGVHVTSIRLIEQGRGSTTLSTVSRLAGALDVPFLDMFASEGEAL